MSAISKYLTFAMLGCTLAFAGSNFGQVDFDNIDFDWDGGSVVLTERGESDPEVRITSTPNLYINDKRIELSEQQIELLEEYHELAFDLRHKAKEIGFEGAKIGVYASGMAVTVLVGALGSILDDDDDWEDDFEDRIESKVERMSDNIEDMAEDLEKVVDELKITHRKLRQEIPELAALGWF